MYKENKVKLLSRVRLFATLWTVAYQAPLSMSFYRQEYWQPTSIFLSGEPHGQYEKSKRCEAGR